VARIRYRNRFRPRKRCLAVYQAVGSDTTSTISVVTPAMIRVALRVGE
jgi:hypothetical protein